MEPAATTDAVNLPQPGPESIPGAGPWRRRLQRCLRFLDATFGLLTVVAGLAVLSVVPVLNLLSFGYLLLASGRIARTGRLRDGLPGLHRAARLGSIVAGTLLVCIPVRFVSGMWKDAVIVAPGSPSARIWQALTLLLAVLTLFQVAWACLRGGRLHHFLWPAPLRFLRWLRNPSSPINLATDLPAWLAALQIPRLLWLGARALAGTLLWLGLPVTLLIASAQLPADRGGGFLALLGALTLAPVVAYLPLLQVHFAVEDRFAALFEVRSVRRLFARAPLAFWLAGMVTLLFALPLYLLKVELPPRGLVWLPSIVFVLFILPARLLAGWAYGRALRHPQPRHGLVRWSARLAAIPVVIAYLLIVYLSQFLSWNGALGLLEQHAFLVPTPWLRF